ncbi:hypothetical protein U3A55_11845 [Salarchaeum sp. III]|uniref:hypothetical protein n=1 Tax=Salarchaeum sp. III TaxID=3107927 RepID=UPI002EDA8E31
MTQQVHPDAPRDDDGHPVHPEKGHRICGRAKSDRTTPSEHGRERDDYPFCLQRAGWGLGGDITEGACKNHGGGGGAPSGEANGAYKHGAFSEQFQRDLSDSEQDALDNVVDVLDDPTQTSAFVRETIGELILKYKRSGDPRFVREARQWASEFGAIDVAPEQVEMAVDHGLTPEEKEQLEAIGARDPQ